MKLGLNRSDYYTPTTKPSCKSDCSGIDNAVQGTNCMWCGDGTIQPGNSENCEVVSDGIKYGNATSDKFDYINAITETFNTYDSAYKIPISGVYEITVKGARGGSGGKGGSSGSNFWCSGSSGGSGGGYARGGTVTAQYYFDKGTTLKLYAGQVGGSGGSGNKDSSTGGTAGTAGQSYSTTYASGYKGDAGTKGNGQAGDPGGSGGGGGGGGGASVVKTSDGTLLILAHGGGGGGGGEGGGPCNSGGNGYAAGSASNKLPCLGAEHSSYNGNSNNSNGGRGQNGGNGGRYSDSQCNYYASGYYSGTTPSSTNGTPTSGNNGAGSISITLKKYAPCNACQFSTTELLDINNKKSECTGLIANAVWSSNSSTSKTITQTYGSSWSPDTAGTHSTDTAANYCYYKCKTNYNYEGGACIHTKTVACTGLPSGAVWSSNNSTTKTITLTYSGADGSGSWEPSTTGAYNTNTTANQCYYKCDSTHTWEGGACINKRTRSCESVPAGAVPNTATSITQNWTAANGWKPSLTPSYNTTASTTECRYKCNTNYTWNSSTKKCVADKHTADCPTDTKPANTDWNTVSQITQEWNGSSWQPVAETVYNTTASTQYCRYKCSDTFHTEDNGASCTPNTRTHSCGILPYENAEKNSVDSYTQNWSDSTSSWTPAATSWTYNDTASTTACRFKCKTHYPWNGSQCKAETRSANCNGALPTNATWNDSSYNHNGTGGTFTQTWDGTKFDPETVNSGYSTTAGKCKYKCKSGYAWLGGVCRQTHFAWGFESELPSSSNWITQESNTAKNWGDNNKIDSGIANPWILTSAGSNGLSINSSSLPSPKEGSKAMCSNIASQHTRNADLVVKVLVPEEYYYGGTLSFSYTGTSEASWDFLQVYIDPTDDDLNYGGNNCSNSATQVVCTDGSSFSSWTQASIHLTSGEHRILFRYHKDGSGNNAADRYCIDDLNLDVLACDSSNTTPLYLKFNEGSGSTTANSGTAGGSYSVNSSLWTALGKHKGAYTFNGSSATGGSSSGTTISTNFTKYSNTFTMMAWVKVTSNYTISLPSQSSSGTNGTSGQHYLFGANHESGNAGAGLSVGTNGIFVTAHGDSYMPPLAVYSGSLGTEWHHVAVVFNNKTPYIYLDDVLVKTGSASQRTTYSPTSIGGGSYGHFNGSLDDVSIIGRALTAQEVLAEYEYGKFGASCSGL